MPSTVEQHMSGPLGPMPRENLTIARGTRNITPEELALRHYDKLGDH